MNRLTTDNPQDNFEAIMNLVYDNDGWQYIRHGDTKMRTTDFCLMLCKERGCVTLNHPMSDEAKDELLCDCVFDGCPIATIYAALSGFGHVRARLKRYEDAGIMPPKSAEKLGIKPHQSEDVHNGCVGCKYAKRSVFEAPCAQCRGWTMITLDPNKRGDLWEAAK